MHSSCSDGTDSPERIVELAADAKLGAFALTDHDTLEGLGVAAVGAAELGLRLIRGCEVSCKVHGIEKSAHLLAYFIDDDEDSPLAVMLGEMRAKRVTRNKAMVAKLNELGIPVNYDALVATAGSETTLGRPHLANAMIALGVLATREEAFEKYLGHGRAAYVSKSSITVKEVSDAARRSGAVTVLAHPDTLGLGASELDALIASLTADGLSGIEAYYSTYAPDRRKALCDLAQRHGLVATGGSDYHGTNKPDLRIGRGTGDLVVPDSVLDDLEARRPA